MNVTLAQKRFDVFTYEHHMPDDGEWDMTKKKTTVSNFIDIATQYKQGLEAHEPVDKDFGNPSRRVQDNRYILPWLHKMLFINVEWMDTVMRTEALTLCSWFISCADIDIIVEHWLSALKRAPVQLIPNSSVFYHSTVYALKNTAWYAQQDVTLKAATGFYTSVDPALPLAPYYYTPDEHIFNYHFKPVEKPDEDALGSLLSFQCKKSDPIRVLDLSRDITGKHMFNGHIFELMAALSQKHLSNFTVRFIGGNAEESVRGVVKNAVLNFFLVKNNLHCVSFYTPLDCIFDRKLYPCVFNSKTNYDTIPGRFVDTDSEMFTREFMFAENANQLLKLKAVQPVVPESSYDETGFIAGFNTLVLTLARVFPKQVRVLDAKPESRRFSSLVSFKQASFTNRDGLMRETIDVNGHAVCLWIDAQNCQFQMALRIGEQVFLHRVPLFVTFSHDLFDKKFLFCYTMADPINVFNARAFLESFMFVFKCAAAGWLFVVDTHPQRHPLSVVRCVTSLPHAQVSTEDRTLIFIDAIFGTTFVAAPSSRFQSSPSLPFLPGYKTFRNLDNIVALPESHRRLTFNLNDDSRIYSIAWSPDGTRLASTSDETVRVWGARTGNCLATLTGHTYTVTSVAWAPDGARLASASWDKTVWVWNPETGKCLITLEGHKDVVTSVAWSPDGARLASASSDTTVRVWEVASGDCLATLTGHTKSVTSVAWAPDGARLASASWDKTVWVWNLETGKCLITLEGHKDVVTSVAWAPDNKHLASASWDTTVRAWDARTGECLATLEGRADYVTSVAWSPDGARLASASDDETVRVWEVATGKCLAALTCHTDTVTFAAWSPASIVTSVAWSPDSSNPALAASLDDGAVNVWYKPKYQRILQMKGHKSYVVCVAWSPDGAHLVSASDDKKVRVWEIASGEQLATLTGHTKSVTSVAWSPDGTRLVSTSGDMSVRVWEVASGKCLATLTGHESVVRSVAWSPDGTYLASASDDKTVRVWEVATGDCLATLTGHTHRVTSVAWSPDGARLASASDDRTVRVWDASEYKCLATLEDHAKFVTSVAWSPDGAHIASASVDYTVRVWDANTYKCLATLRGHKKAVGSVAWSPDGARLASASDDRTVRVWDVDSGTCLTTLTGYTDVVTSVAWSPHGKRLASASDDTTVCVWAMQV